METATQSVEQAGYFDDETGEYIVEEVTEFNNELTETTSFSYDFRDGEIWVPAFDEAGNPTGEQIAMSGYLSGSDLEQHQAAMAALTSGETEYHREAQLSGLSTADTEAVTLMHYELTDDGRVTMDSVLEHREIDNGEELPPTVPDTAAKPADPLPKLRVQAKPALNEISPESAPKPESAPAPKAWWEQPVPKPAEKPTEPTGILEYFEAKPDLEPEPAPEASATILKAVFEPAVSKPLELAGDPKPAESNPKPVESIIAPSIESPKSEPEPPVEPIVEPVKAEMPQAKGSAPEPAEPAEPQGVANAPELPEASAPPIESPADVTKPSGGGLAVEASAPEVEVPGVEIPALEVLAFEAPAVALGSSTESAAVSESTTESATIALATESVTIDAELAAPVVETAAITSEIYAQEIPRQKTAAQKAVTQEASLTPASEAITAEITKNVPVKTEVSEPPIADTLTAETITTAIVAETAPITETDLTTLITEAEPVDTEVVPLQASETAVVSEPVRLDTQAQISTMKSEMPAMTQTETLAQAPIAGFESLEQPVTIPVAQRVQPDPSVIVQTAAEPANIEPSEAPVLEVPVFEAPVLEVTAPDGLEIDVPQSEVSQRTSVLNHKPAVASNIHPEVDDENSKTVGEWAMNFQAQAQTTPGLEALPTIESTGLPGYFGQAGPGDDDDINISFDLDTDEPAIRRPARNHATRSSTV